jgi:hypothetical protein
VLVSEASLQAQNASIKYAFDMLSGFNLTADRNKTILDIRIGASSQLVYDLLGKITVLDFLMCLTSHIQFVWPGSDLTVDT